MALVPAKFADKTVVIKGITKNITSESVPAYGSINVNFNNDDLQIPQGYTLVGVSRIFLTSSSSNDLYFQARVRSLSPKNYTITLTVSNVTGSAHTLSTASIMIIYVKDEYVEYIS